MTSVLPDTGPAYDGDPLRPDLETPTPDDVVARLSPAERQLRVLALIEQARQIYADALATHTGDREVVGTCLLWSGGNDSNTLAHLMRRYVTHVVHANTGIGLEETRQFVRDTAAAWDLPLIEKHPPAGSTYRDYVLTYGFPGPGQHYRMYQRLKERALRQARKELVRNGRRQRVVFLAGRRRAESKRREDVPLHEREDSVIWVSPMAMWTKLDINTYRAMHDDVPHNEVCDHVHMSGECLCGSFAKPGELDQLRLFYPATAAYIEALQDEADEAGIPAPRNRWGWGAYRTDDQRGPTADPTDDQPVGRLCSSCTSPFNQSGPESRSGCPMPRNTTTSQAIHLQPEDSVTTALRIVEPQHLTGAALLDAVTGFLSRFIVFPNEHCAPAIALWFAHTHAAEHFYVTPRLVISSAEPGSGKTLVIEIGQYLVAKPEMTLNASTSAVFRMVAHNGPITLLWDEVDAIFTSNGGTNEDLRAMLNAGYKRTAYVARCVGDSHSVQRFPVYSPVALVGLAGAMPATITTRAITIHMRRKKRGDTAEEFRERIVQRDAEPLRDALSNWIGGIAETIGEAEPAMPPGVANRSREIWEPLLAIADAAGGHWPHTARAACAYFVREAEQQPVTNGVRLLSDLRTIYADRDTDRLATVDIVADLVALDEAPWGDINGGRPLDARRLARELALYHVTPVPFRTGGQITKGYVTYPTNNQVGLTDAWSRYLPTTDDDTETEGESWEH